MQQFEKFLDGSALCTKSTPGYFLKLGNFTNASQNGSGTFSHRDKISTEIKNQNQPQFSHRDKISTSPKFRIRKFDPELPPMI